jgi:uncharacterized membrane protein YccC
MGLKWTERQHALYQLLSLLNERISRSAPLKQQVSADWYWPQHQVFGLRAN